MAARRPSAALAAPLLSLVAPVALVALGTLVGAGCSSTEVDEPEPEELLDLYMTTATYLYQDESLVRAQDQAVKALEIDPDNRPMRRMIGWIRLRLGGTEDLFIAEEMFRRLVEQGDRETSTLLGMANAQERIGVLEDRSARAIASGERATDHPDPEERAAELAASAQRRWERAHDLYEQVLSGPTFSTKALNGLARVSALVGRYDESLDWSRQLLEQSRAEAEGWRNVLQSADLSEEGEREARRSEAAATTLQHDTHLFAASILRRLGRTSEALEHLDAAIALGTPTPPIYGQRAQLLADLGRWEAAIADVDRFLATSDAPFDSADVRAAYQLRSRCERALDERTP